MICNSSPSAICLMFLNICCFSPALGLFFPLELLADVEFEVVDELVDNLALELVEACEFGM